MRLYRAGHGESQKAVVVDRGQCCTALREDRQIAGPDNAVVAVVVDLQKGKGHRP